MLNGWKEIAGYLRRDERTARRWAAEASLPVHRIPGPGRGSVYAIADEIDAWLATDRERIAESATAGPAIIDAVPMVELSPVPRWRWRWVASAVIALGALLVTVGVLTLRHSRAEPTVAGAVYTDPATKAMFLQASYDWNLRTPDSLARAVQEYGDTIARDPRVPAAYVGLANSYLLLREYGSLRDADAYARAEAAAQAAVALSPTCAEAHRALAFIAFWWQQDRITARREFQTAIALKPNDPLTHHWLANALLANGEREAALREIDQARDLDPNATSIVGDHAAILYFAGHHAEGLAGLRDLAREQPQDVGPHRTLAQIALFEDRPSEFLAEFATTARLRSDKAGVAEATHWRSAGPGVRGIEEAMLRDARKTRAGWFQIAKLAAMAGQRDEAKDAIARACDAHEPATISASSDLWLSRVLTTNDIAERCGSPPSLL